MKEQKKIFSQLKKENLKNLVERQKQHGLQMYKTGMAEKTLEEYIMKEVLLHLLQEEHIMEDF
jgi:hypothetical protein